MTLREPLCLSVPSSIGRRTWWHRPFLGVLERSTGGHSTGSEQHPMRRKHVAFLQRAGRAREGRARAAPRPHRASPSLCDPHGHRAHHTVPAASPRPSRSAQMQAPATPAAVFDQGLRTHTRLGRAAPGHALGNAERPRNSGPLDHPHCSQAPA